MNACDAGLGLCRCEMPADHLGGEFPIPHECHCGCTWRTGDAGVQFGTQPVQPAVRS